MRMPRRHHMIVKIINAYSDDEINNYEESPKIPYDGGNINAYSNNQENNYEVAPNPPTNDENRNANSDNEKIFGGYP